MCHHGKNTFLAHKFLEKYKCCFFIQSVFAVAEAFPARSEDKLCQGQNQSKRFEGSMQSWFLFVVCHFFLKSCTQFEEMLIAV